MVAFERIHRDHRMTQHEFCSTLGIPERTFRSWKKRPPAPERPRPAPTPPPADSPPPAAAHRGRFDLAEIPPGVELTADTTDIDLFDIPLKLIAAQDPGWRDSELCEAFHLDVVEDARRVADVVEAAVRNRPVALFVTDQGTPYRAEDARKAYEAHGLEHAPTKEGTPTQKATIERMFGTLKPLLAPAVAFTSMLAAAVPALRTPALAVTVGRYLVALALNAYRIGASSRIAQAGAPPDRAVVEAIAEDWVHRRREDHGSCRLLLERIHEEFRMEGSREDFVRALRRHELEDIKEAERRLRTAACRCQARACDRYFVGILRNVAAAAEPQRQEGRRRVREQALQAEKDRQAVAYRDEMRAHPERAIHHGLTLIGIQWLATKRDLLMEGRGIDYSDLRRGLADLRVRDGIHAARDGAEVVWRQWAADAKSVDGDGRRAIRVLWERLLSETFGTTERDFSAMAAGRIINPPPLPSNPRSPRRVLRIRPARVAGIPQVAT